MPSNSKAHQAAARLKAALTRRLASSEDLSESLKKGLYQSVLMVERFLAYADGTELEFEVLKEKIEDIMLTCNRPLMKAKKKQMSAFHRNDTEAAMESSSRATPRMNSAPPSRHAAVSTPVPSEVDYTLPPLYVARRGNIVNGDFTKLVTKLDERDNKKIQAEKELARRNKQELKAQLDRQMEDVREQRRQEVEMKRRAAAESKQQQAEYEDLQLNKARQHQQACKQWQQERKQHVAEARLKAQVLADMETAESRAVLEKALQEQAELEEQKRQKLAANKKSMELLVKENDQKLELKRLEKDKEKAYNLEIAKMGERLAEQQEAARLAALEVIAEKGRKMLKMGGMDELVAAREAKIRKEDEDTRRQQAEYAVKQDQLMREKQQLKEKRMADQLAGLEKQKEEHRLKMEAEMQERREMAEQMREDHLNYKKMEEEHSAARKAMIQANKAEIQEQWRADQKRRYKENQFPMVDNEIARNRRFMEVTG